MPLLLHPVTPSPTRIAVLALLSSPLSPLLCLPLPCPIGSSLSPWHARPIDSPPTHGLALLSSRRLPLLSPPNPVTLHQSLRHHSQHRHLVYIATIPGHPRPNSSHLSPFNLLTLWHSPYGYPGNAGGPPILNQGQVSAIRTIRPRLTTDATRQLVDPPRTLSTTLTSLLSPPNTLSSHHRHVDVPVAPQMFHAHGAHALWPPPDGCSLYEHGDRRKVSSLQVVITPVSSLLVTDGTSAALQAEGVRQLTQLYTNGDDSQSLADAHQIDGIVTLAKDETKRKIILEVLKGRLALQWPYNYRALDIMANLAPEHLVGMLDDISKYASPAAGVLGGEHLKAVTNSFIDKVKAAKAKKEADEFEKKQKEMMAMWGPLWTNQPAAPVYPAHLCFPHTASQPVAYPYVPPGLSCPPVTWSSRAPEGWTSWVAPEARGLHRCCTSSW